MLHSVVEFTMQVKFTWLVKCLMLCSIVEFTGQVKCLMLCIVVELKAGEVFNAGKWFTVNWAGEVFSAAKCFRV